MEKKVWRPLNTYGIYLLGITVGFTVIYAIVSLTPMG
jgi:hypothetical protein